MASHSDLWGSRTERMRRRPRRRWGRVFLALVGGLTAAVALYVAAMAGVAVARVSQPLPAAVRPELRPLPVQAGQRTNLLIIGLDDEKRRPDTLALVSLDPAARTAFFLEIPPETRALLAGQGTFGTLASSYAAGLADPQFPANLRALKTVEDLLGVPIHDTVVVDPAGLRQAVDAVGGVTLGTQKLQGQQALEFLRGRDDNKSTGLPDGDLGRIQAQQQVLGALLSQLLRPANLPVLPDRLVSLSGHVSTTMAPGRVLSLARLVMAINQRDVEFATLPGTGATLQDALSGERVDYFLADPVATRKLLDRAVQGAAVALPAH